MDDSEVVAEPLDLTHDVGREDDGLPAVPAVADEADDRARGYHIEPGGGHVKNNKGRFVAEGAGDGGFLLQPGGNLVAPPVAKTVHIQAVENVVDALFERGLVEAIQAAKVLDKLLGRQARVKGCSCGQEAGVRANLFRLLNDVMAADHRSTVGRRRYGGEHTEHGGLASPVRAKQSVNLSGLAGEADIVHGSDFTALFVLKPFGQSTNFDH